MSASIIIPVYDALDYAQACLESIYEAQAKTPFEVIVVNNGSSPQVQQWLDLQPAHREGLRILHFEQPLGFARAVNQGARVARHERLVVLNSDTLVTDGWLDRLSEALDADPGLGVVSPVTNSCGHEVQADPDAADLQPSEAGAYALHIRERREILAEPQRLTFFCVMVRRSIWEHLAGLEEGFGRGNFEDDDFCLRVRLLGCRLAIARHAFVFHHEGKTFQEKRLDHGEWMARNQALFCSRASRWAKSTPPVRESTTARAAAPANPSVVVIVPVTPEKVVGLGDSLASLANQTMQNLAVIVVTGTDVSPIVEAFSDRLQLQMIRTVGERAVLLAALLNDGVDAAHGKRIAFLPAGDLYYPFHLEVLLAAAGSSSAPVYSAWAFEAAGRTGAVRFDQAAPDRLALGDWVALAGWLCPAGITLPRFDESLADFAGWDFALQMSKISSPTYLRRSTCQKRVAPGSVQEARQVMASHPVEPGSAWHEEEREQFLRAVESGAWETALIFGRNEVERRARRLFAPPEPLATNARDLDALKARLVAATSCDEENTVATTSRPDVFLFNIVGWTHLVQRPHHFARGLAARGHRVFWIDVKLKVPSLTDSASLVRSIESNLFYVELPAAAGEFYLLRWNPAVEDAMEAAIAWLRGAFGVTTAVQLVNYPKWTPLVDRLRERFGWPVVYDCLDNQQAFGELHRLNEAQFEEGLSRGAAAVVASGQTLFDRQRSLNPNTTLIPNAADYELFSSATPAGLPQDLPRPVIGFYGAFSEWLDRAWIAEAAKRYRDWSFVYIGRPGFARGASQRDWSAATAAKNITVLPQVDLPTLARYLADFQACIMPFRDLAITRSMNAVKLYEYLAAGKPVVAPDLPETRPLAEQELISIYRTWDESFELLEAAVLNGADVGEVRKRRAFAARNTWDHRVDDLAATLNRITAEFGRPHGS